MAVVKQIHQPVTGQDTLTVIDNGQSCIQIGIIAEHGFHKLRTEL